MIRQKASHVSSVLDPQEVLLRRKENENYARRVYSASCQRSPQSRIYSDACQSQSLTSCQYGCQSADCDAQVLDTRLCSVVGHHVTAPIACPAH